MNYGRVKNLITGRKVRRQVDGVYSPRKRRSLRLKAHMDNFKFQISNFKLRLNFKLLKAINFNSILKFKRTPEQKLKKLRVKILKREFSMVKIKKNNSLEKFLKLRFRKAERKNFEFLISNFESISNFIISNVLKIIKFINSYFIQNSKFKIQNSFRGYLFSRNFLRKATALMIIFSVLATAYFQNANNASAATYTWKQLTWAGGETATTWSHAEEQASPESWTKYTNNPAKDANLSAGTSLALSTTSGTPITQTNEGSTNTGFNLSGNDKDSGKIVVSGTGDSASVILGPAPTNYTLTQTNNSVTIPTAPGSLTGGFNNRPVYNEGCLDGATYECDWTPEDCDNAYGTWGEYTQCGFNYTEGLSNTEINPAGTGGADADVELTTSIASKTAIFIGPNNNGNLGGRSGANALCQNSANKPSGATDIKAFLSVSSTDEIRDLQTTDVDSDGITGPYSSSKSIDWYNASTQAFTQLASSWTDMLDGSISVTQQNGTGGPSAQTWTASDSAGALDANNCTNWTNSSSGNGRAGTYNSTATWLSSGNYACTSGTRIIECIATTPAVYNSTGTYISYADAGASALSYTWNTFSWSETVPSGGDITVKVKTTATASEPSFASGTCDGSGSPITLTDSCRNSAHRYIWYQTTLTAGTGNTTTPTLDQIQVSVDRNAYQSSGTYTSGVINTGQPNASWGSFSWNATLNGQTLTMKARTCSASDCAGATAWTSCSNITSGNALSTGGCTTNGHQYVQYQASLSGDTISTPSLDDVTIGYNYYPTSQTLISSAFDTGDALNVIGGLSWNEDASLPSGTTVTISLRTASTQGGLTGAWTDFTNATANCSKASTTVTCTAAAIPAGMKDGTNDRWFQYKVTLTSAGQNTPSVADVTTTYVINAPPAVAINSAAQNSDGTISINYNLSDTDSSSFTVSAYADLGITLNETLDSSDTTITLSSTTLLPTSGTAMFDNEQITYTGKSGNDLTGCTRGANNTNTASHSSGAVAWAKATTASGIGVGQSAGNGKTISWTIKTDYDGAYNATGKIRVSANDGNLANQVGSGNSSNFAIDTKDPTGFAITNIDHTLNKVVITAATEDSNYEVYIDNASGTLFDAGKITSPLLNQTSSYPNNYTFSALSTMGDPATVYVGVKDAKGNTAYVTKSTPDNPASILYYDISNTSTEEWREIIIWSLASGDLDHYDIYRSTDGVNYSSVHTEPNPGVNYYIDEGLDTANTYYYKVQSVAADGSKSKFTDPVHDQPDGVGSSDLTPPVITNAAVSEITTNSAKVTWRTDEVSTSQVWYSTDFSYDTPAGTSVYAPIDPDTGFIEHEINLSGLTPNTTYHIKLISSDVSGNPGEVCFGGDGCSYGPNDPNVFTFDTSDGPAISKVRIKESTNTQATISWETNEDSDSHVFYSDTVTNGELIGATGTTDPAGTDEYVGGSYPFVHEVTLTGLTQSNSYYFYVQSESASGLAELKNVSSDPPYFTFITGNDSIGPEISNISEVITNNTQVAINWTTNEPADSKVEYKKDGESYSDNAPVEELDIFNKSHYIIISNLEPDTEYTYRITSSDINGNQTEVDDNVFTTQKNPEFQHDPLTTITMLYNEGDEAGDPKVLTDTKAVIAFNTDQAAQCTIEYGTESGNYAEVPIVETLYNENHSMHITGLIFSTTYYYQISCLDNLTTPVSTDEYDFITLEEQMTEGEAGALGDSTAPEISGVSAGTITGESAIITWDTDENANSLVKYGTTSDYGKMEGNDLINSTAVEYLTSHEVAMQGLIPGTKYYFTAISIDAAGNIGESSEQTFTTKDPPKFNSINVESDNLGEVLIKWITDEKMSSIIDYGLTTSYGDTKESSSKSLEHSLTLSSLKTSEIYHFRLRGENADNNLFASADYTFVPKSPPKISNIKTELVSEHSMKVSFNTDVPADTLITYADVADAKNAGSQGNPALVSTHEIELKDLIPGTTYNMIVRVKDEQGNETDDATQKFTTGVDKNPPVIEKIRTESALAQSDKVQSIIHWTTDELATTAIIFKEGQAGQEKEINSSNILALEHVVVITSFKPGTVYYFKVKSIDAAKNEAVSTEHAVLTPQRKENIIQIIINNFQDIFGWARF